MVIMSLQEEGGDRVLFSTAATAGFRGLSFMTSKSLFLEEEDKSYFLCFFLHRNGLRLLDVEDNSR